MIFFISSTSEEHTVFDKYISDTKNHIINIYICTALIICPMMYYQTEKNLLDNINEVHLQTKTLTLLIVCKENPELYLYQIIQ